MWIGLTQDNSNQMCIDTSCNNKLTWETSGERFHYYSESNDGYKVNFRNFQIVEIINRMFRSFYPWLLVKKVGVNVIFFSGEIFVLKISAKVMF